MRFVKYMISFCCGLETKKKTERKLENGALKFMESYRRARFRDFLFGYASVFVEYVPVKPEVTLLNRLLLY